MAIFLAIMSGCGSIENPPALSESSAECVDFGSATECRSGIVTCRTTGGAPLGHCGVFLAGDDMAPFLALCVESCETEVLP